MGKNNQKMITEKEVSRNPKYCIRKLNLGVASVAVGTLLSVGVTNVNAEELVTTEASLAEEVSLEISDSKEVFEERVIENDFTITNEQEEKIEDAYVEVWSDESIKEMTEDLSEMSPGGAVEDIAEEVTEEVERNEEVLEKPIEGADDTEGANESDDSEYIIPDEVIAEEEDIDNREGDINAPEVINLYTDKSTYEVGEKIKLHLEVKDSSKIDVNAFHGDFGMHTNGASFTIGGLTVEDYTLNQEGNHELVFSYAVPKNVMSGIFQLDYLRISDIYNNINVIFDENLLAKSKINILQGDPNNMGIGGSQLIKVDLDKKVYEAGETASINIEFANKNPIYRVEMRFGHDTTFIDAEVNAWEFSLNKYGNYEANILVDISPHLLSGSYFLDYLSFSDIYNNTQHLYNDTFKNLPYFEVKNDSPIIPIKDEIVNVHIENDTLKRQQSTKVIIEFKSDLDIEEVELLFLGRLRSEGSLSNKFYSKTKNITLQSNGNYKAVFDIQILKDSLSDVFSISTATLRDSNNFEKIISSYSGFFPSPILYYINPDADVKDNKLDIFKNVFLDKEFYSRGDVAQIVLEIESPRGLESVLVNIDVFKDLFTEKRNFRYALRLKDIKEVSNGLYHVNYEYPILYPDGIDKLFLHVINIVDGNENFNYDFEGKKAHTIKLQHAREDSSIMPVPFEVKRIPSYSLTPGEEIVIRDGRDGKKTVYYEVNYHADKELSRAFVREELIKEPITQLILVGIAEVREEEKDKSESSLPDASKKSESDVENKDLENITPDANTPNAEDEMLEEEESENSTTNEIEKNDSDRGDIKEDNILVTPKDFEQSSAVSLPNTGELNDPYLVTIGTSILVGIGLLKSTRRGEK